MSTGTGHIELRDIEVSYRATGAGTPVVLLHGLAQDHRMWSHFQDGADEHLTIAFDLRGHGGTTLGDADGSLAQLGADLIAALERIGPSCCVGFSMGGAVALWAAAERPDLVTSVVALATSSAVGSAAYQGLQDRIALFETGGVEQIRASLLHDTQDQLALSVDATRILDDRLQAIGDARGYINGARAMAGMHGQSLNERLQTIRCPVLVVGGARDVVCPRRAAEIMLHHLSNAEFVELEGSGHLMTDEDPARVTATIVEWLDRQGNAA